MSQSLLAATVFDGLRVVGLTLGAAVAAVAAAIGAGGVVLGVWAFRRGRPDRAQS